MPSDKVAPLNRAERRRRGMTRSRLKRAGSLTSAGVLLSAGLMGAYVGNPRLPRAYASTGCNPLIDPVNKAVVSDEGELATALDDSNIICIEIDGLITLTADLPVITGDEWFYPSPRESSSLVITGHTGDDTIFGDGFSGVRLDLDSSGLPGPVDDVELYVSNLTMNGFQGNSAPGAAVAIEHQGPNVTYIYLRTTDVTFQDNDVTTASGGAVAVRSQDANVKFYSSYSRFLDNEAYSGGGAVSVYSAGGTALFQAGVSVFARNSTAYDGGAINVATNSVDGDILIETRQGNTYVNNVANRGGAISAVTLGDSSDIEFAVRSEFLSNGAGDEGGAIFASTRSTGAGTGEQSTINMSLANSFFRYNGNTDITPYGATPAPAKPNRGGAISATTVGSASSVAVYASGTLLIGNEASGKGGGIYATTSGPAASVTVSVRDNSLVSYNIAGNSGGAVSAQTSGDSASMNLEVYGSRLLYNESDASGGAIYGYTTGLNAPVNAVIYASEFSFNEALSAGGAVALGTGGDNSGVYLRDEGESTFEDNSAGVNGGAVAAYALGDGSVATVVFDEATFEDNSSDSYGGAIFVQSDSSGLLEMASCTVEGNRSQDGGGAAAITYGQLEAVDSEFSFNYAGESGGALYVEEGELIIENSSFTNNRAAGPGGAVAVDGEFYATQAVFYENESYDNGGAVFVQGDEAIVMNSEFNDNSSGGYGGGLFNAAYLLDVESTTFSFNSAFEAGGGIFSAGETFITYSSLFGNQANVLNGSPRADASYTGGGVLMDFEPLTVTNSFVGGNYAYKGGGIASDDTVTLYFTTLYDNSSVDDTLPTEITASRISSVGSIVGNSQYGFVLDATAVDDSFSVSTSDKAGAGQKFNGLTSGNVAPGGLDMDPLVFGGPGESGREPAADSVAALPVASGGFAPLTSPLPLVPYDQVREERESPFTIGARQVVAAVVPSAPTGLAATPGDGSATILFTPGAPGSAAITNYEYSLDGGTTWLPINPAVTTSPVVISGLTNGVTYSVTLRAVSSAGNGAASSAVSVTPSGSGPAPDPGFAPSAPVGVSGVPGDGSVTVSWGVPESAGSFAITDYEVMASPGGQVCLVKAPELSCVVSGLSNGTSYTFMVRALNGAGWGPWSVASDPVTPSGKAASLALVKGERVAQNRGKDRIRATGSAVGIPAGTLLTPYVRLSGQSSFSRGKASITVASDGSFRWTRLVNKAKRVAAYVAWEDVESNRVVWAKIR